MGTFLSCSSDGIHDLSDIELKFQLRSPSFSHPHVLLVISVTSTERMLFPSAIIRTGEDLDRKPCLGKMESYIYVLTVKRTDVGENPPHSIKNVIKFSSALQLT